MKKIIIAGLLLLGSRAAPAQTAAGGLSLSTVTGNESYAIRSQAAAQLGETLNENEIHSLILFLQRRSAEDVLAMEELNALKNEVVNLLRRQDGFADELAERLMEMHRAPGTDEVWRDYCIQHLGALFPEMDGALRGPAAELFFKATDVKGGSLCGTALIALNSNTNVPEIDAERVGTLAVEVASSADRGSAARTTAIQIASQLGVPSVLPVARQLMGDPHQVSMLRMSAVAAVGALGDADDLNEITRLCGSRDARIRRAAVSALKQLNATSPSTQRNAKKKGI